MLKTTLSAVALLLTIASADAFTVTTACQRSPGLITCQTQVLPPMSNSARVIELAPARESQDAWAARCQAVLVPGAKSYEPHRWQIGNPACR